MKLRRSFIKASAAALLCVSLLYSGLSSSENPEAYVHALDQAGDTQDELTIAKMGFGLPDRTYNPVKSTVTRLPLGPGAKLFGGGRLTLLSNQTASQMMSFVIETAKGSVIVVDGGKEGDADHLMEKIREKGGHVSAWFITHPHSDHIGALTEILNNPDSRITIDHVYYSLEDQAWYDTNEAYRADMVVKLREALAKLPPERLHGDIVKGQEIWIDDVKVTVMNEPYLFDYNSINNSSVAYKFIMNGVSILFLGDMGPDAGDQFLAEHTPEELKSDIVQMSHHGQYGVNRQVYEAIQPSVSLWPTPDWLWNNDNGGGANSGPWSTLETRQWMQEIGVKLNYCIKDGDQVIE